jgi:hypothetical protein
MTHRQPPFGRGADERDSLQLFRLSRRGQTLTQLSNRIVANEKALQILIERHLLALHNVQFLATEYATGLRHRGRIDTLGIDPDGSPVVIEYKRKQSVNLLSQGLFYLDWLDDHRGEFLLLVQDRLGPDAFMDRRRPPRLICVAAGFSRYELRAVRPIGRRVELVQYAWYDEVLVLESLST